MADESEVGIPGAGIIGKFELAVPPRARQANRRGRLRRRDTPLAIRAHDSRGLSANLEQMKFLEEIRSTKTAIDTDVSFRTSSRRLIWRYSHVKAPIQARKQRLRFFRALRTAVAR